MPRPLPLVATLLAFIAAGSGCASDPPAQRARGGHVALTLDDFSITPQRIRAARRPLVLEVANRGRLAHNLVVRLRGRDVGQLRSLRGGGHGTLRVALERGGDYRLVCSLANHEELGMSGTLEVR